MCTPLTDVYKRQEYAGRIRIYMGIEQDLYSTSPTAGYDYVIDVYKRQLQHELNEEIRDKEIRLIGETGEQMGICLLYTSRCV